MGIGLALGQCGLSPMSGMSPGGGMGGDDRNTGPRAKTNDVKNMDKVSAEMGEGGQIFSMGETKGAPDKEDSGASVPYTEVLPDYKKAAESALDKEKVPPAYRTRVKDYFSSLEE